MYLDLQRHSWYEEETIKESVRGRWEELIRSKLAYTGVVADQVIAEKWSALRDCPDGSWGKAVADFYDRHGFPFPGERFGIYELGARHDWVHVLAGYETDPEGELDVFAFIAASMTDERGLVLLAITLGLFQNGSIHHVAGKQIKIARADTLTDDGAVDRWVEAFRRGNLCTTDVMGTVRLFEHKDEPLDEVRERFGVCPVRSVADVRCDSTARRLLVSVPTLHDPNFFRSVVFMIEHTDEGALGARAQPADRDPHRRPCSRRGRRTPPRPAVAFVGGPVQQHDALIGLARVADVDPGDGDAWQPLLGRIGTVDLGRDPHDARADLEAVRIFAGYSGWAPSQLEGELEAGGWFVVDALPDDLLDVRPGRLWRAVLRRQGGDVAVSANYPLGGEGPALQLTSVGRCLPTQRRGVERILSSPRTPTTSTSATPVPSPAGPTPASRSSYCICTSGEAGGFDRSVPRTHDGGDPRGRAARGGEGRRRHRRHLPRVPRRPPRVDLRPAPRHQPRASAACVRSGWSASRRSATSSASTPATPITSPPARPRWPRCTRTPATPSPTPSCSRRGSSRGRSSEMYLATAGAPDVFVDITDTFERKIDALRCHVSQHPDLERARRPHPGLERGQRRARRAARGPPRRVVPARRHEVAGPHRVRCSPARPLGSTTEDRLHGTAGAASGRGRGSVGDGEGHRRARRGRRREGRGAGPGRERRRRGGDGARWLLPRERRHRLRGHRARPRRRDRDARRRRRGGEHRGRWRVGAHDLEGRARCRSRRSSRSST